MCSLEAFVKFAALNYHVFKADSWWSQCGQLKLCLLTHTHTHHGGTLSGRFISLTPVGCFSCLLPFTYSSLSVFHHMCKGLCFTALTVFSNKYTTAEYIKSVAPKKGCWKSHLPLSWQVHKVISQSDKKWSVWIVKQSSNEYHFQKFISKPSHVALVVFIQRDYLHGSKR